MAAEKILIPPIRIGTAVIPSTAGLRLVADIDIRARDLEVARCVLDAAAKAFEAEVDTWDEMKKRGYSGAIRRKGAATIRALEFTHA